MKFQKLKYPKNMQNKFIKYFLKKILMNKKKNNKNKNNNLI